MHLASGLFCKAKVNTKQVRLKEDSEELNALCGLYVGVTAKFF